MNAARVLVYDLSECECVYVYACALLGRANYACMLIINFLRIVLWFGLMSCNCIDLDYQKLLTLLMAIMWENSISSSEIPQNMHSEVILHNVYGH
jgi:hypothetical protein